MSSTGLTERSSFYNRQQYVLGSDGLEQLFRSKVFLYGLGPTGCEIAKNLVLAGVSTLSVSPIRDEEVTDPEVLWLAMGREKTNGSYLQAYLDELNSMNPVVTVNSIKLNLDNLDSLLTYQCVVLSGCPLRDQIAINNFCRKAVPPIKFISTDQYFSFGYVFCDFGDRHDVWNITGEERREGYVTNVLKGEIGEIVCDNDHNLNSGDFVMLLNMNGIEALNNTVHKVTVTSRNIFRIGDLRSASFGEYVKNGRWRQIWRPTTFTFDALETQTTEPTFCSSCETTLPSPLPVQVLHSIMVSLNNSPGNQTPDKFISEILSNSVKLGAKLSDEWILLIGKVLKNCRMILPPLSAVLGGWVAQETIKALTKMFRPTQQWFYYSLVDILQLPNNTSNEVILNPGLVKRIASSKVFVIGCGAIGCEVLKNLASLKVGTQEPGLITITDYDHIEISNLSRQLLFRKQHLQQAKSEVASLVLHQIDPDIHVMFYNEKMTPLNEENIFNNDMLELQDVVFAAVDNIDARRYIDNRVVITQRPMIDSGTLGNKGHVQVILPHLSENYSNQSDPTEVQVPFCTVKSFPSRFEHTVEWARMKFGNLFNERAHIFNQFWEVNGSPSTVVKLLQQRNINLENITIVTQMLKHQPDSLEDCVLSAWAAFIKYFNATAKRMIAQYPLDLKETDGSLFWKSPKIPPSPVTFDPENKLHVLFVKSMTKLLAEMWNIPLDDDQDKKIGVVLASDDLKEVNPENNQVQPEKNMTGNSQDPENPEIKKQKMDDSVESTQSELMVILAKLISLNGEEMTAPRVNPIIFDKDDNSHGHIDFIHSASNLRAIMYGILPGDSVETRRLAGKIVPAIVTTTAVIAGLVTLEFLRLECMAMNTSLNQHRNSFLNLATNNLIQSEPLPVKEIQIDKDVKYSLWTRWEMKGNENQTLNEFLSEFRKKYHSKVTMIVQGKRPIYFPVFGKASKESLKSKMAQLIEVESDLPYVDLVVGLKSGQKEEATGPRVRYFYRTG